jgi:hypothetical protein
MNVFSDECFRGIISWEPHSSTSFVWVSRGVWLRAVDNLKAGFYTNPMNNTAVLLVLHKPLPQEHTHWYFLFDSMKRYFILSNTSCLNPEF